MLKKIPKFAEFRLSARFLDQDKLDKMKLKFKKQAYQSAAVEAVVDCFQGQPLLSSLTYRIDPGRLESAGGQQVANPDLAGYRNADLVLPPEVLLANIRKVQQRQNLPVSNALASDKVALVNLDVEMETGTGKTYCYVKTIFELNRRYGWGKFIIVVPSIAIREGVHKSLQITAEHFLEDYRKKARFFIYNSKRLHELESFSSDAGINVLIINVQAFNAKGQDARRIYDELDGFQSRKPIDVIRANQPILILDEPQKMEGKKTLESFQEFNPLFLLRYSATHKTTYNKIHRLDAIDAYNQKLVKKIAVRGISVRGLPGKDTYLYLDSIRISPAKPPEARLELEIKRKSGGIQRDFRIVKKGDNLFDVSDGLEEYRNWVVADINALTDTVSFTHGEEIRTGEARGHVDEANLRRIQIREAIQAHFDKERSLFHQGIKVLSLFFIDEVAKYRRYEGSEETAGEYARIFEEEYVDCLNRLPRLSEDSYFKYLDGIAPGQTHEGYFSIDNKTKRLIDPETGKKSSEADDVDAYDLILKKKERLLSFKEPVRFLFSHSALREGWDNPNVFVICTLKHSDSSVTRRQEVGRGLRLCVNQNGDRMDHPATVHQVNVLTVVANESYQDFVKGLQKDIGDSLSERPRKADEAYFTGKILRTPDGEIVVTPLMAKQVYKYLVKHDYLDDHDGIAEAYHDAKTQGALAPLPSELQPLAPAIFDLVDTVYSIGQGLVIENERREKKLEPNANFEKRAFKELWERVNRKAAYTVQFDSPELIQKCIRALDLELKVSPLQYTVQRGEQTDQMSFVGLSAGKGFEVKESETAFQTFSVHSSVKYDLVGTLAEATQLTRRTVVAILQGIREKTFLQFRTNPEEFLREAGRLIKEQKATVIIEHLSYSPVDETFSIDIFTRENPKESFDKATPTPQRNIYDYVFTQSKNESEFVKELDASLEVAVYTKLPRGFFIPTPVGEYNPDWAIAFQEGKVKHVYFVAETKGSMSSLELREIEKSKIECARKFFAKITSEQVKYDVVDSFGRLMDLIRT